MAKNAGSIATARNRFHCIIMSKTSMCCTVIRCPHCSGIPYPIRTDGGEGSEDCEEEDQEQGRSMLRGSHSSLARRVLRDSHSSLATGVGGY